MSESFPNAEVSIFSSLCWGQLPLSQHMITEDLRWNTVCSCDSRPVTDQTVVCLRSTFLLWRKRSASRLQANLLILTMHDNRLRKTIGVISCRRSSHPLMNSSRSAPRPSRSASNSLNLLGQRCVCKRDIPSSSLYQGCGQRGEMDTSGVREWEQISEFTSH